MVTKKCSPFALQKDPFCVVKGPLLESKRTTFGVQKDYIWSAKGLLLQAVPFCVIRSARLRSSCR